MEQQQQKGVSCCFMQALSLTLLICRKDGSCIPGQQRSQKLCLATVMHCIAILKIYLLMKVKQAGDLFDCLIISIILTVTRTQ